MAAVAVIVVFAGIAVAILPAAPADAQTGPNATSANGPQVAAGPFMHDLRLTQWPVPTPRPSLDPNAAIAAAPSPTPTATPTPTPTPTPTAKPKPKPKLKPRPIVYADTVAGARAYVRARVGSRQYNCIDPLWQRESKWNPRAGRVKGAYGIPQAFPGSKMAQFGSNWVTSALTQVKWGIWYVDSHYGSPCAAWAFWQVHGWY